MLQQYVTDLPYYAPHTMFLYEYACTSTLYNSMSWCNIDIKWLQCLLCV